jgi:AsmA protein
MMMKRYLKIAGIVVACFLVLLMALPLFVNVNSFRPKIESEASNALGRPVTLGSLSLSILSGSIGVESISIGDDPAFSRSPFVTAKSLKVDVKMIPLIFSKQIEVNGIVLEEPEISLIRAANGTWNFSSLGGAHAKNPREAKAGSAAPQNLSIGELEIKDGKLTVGRANSTAKPQVYDKVNVEVKNFSLNSRFPFELSAGLPGDGRAELSGEAGPINQTNAAATPFDASVKVDKMNVAASGFIDPASGIAGLVSLDGKLNSDGTMAKGTGKITCTNAKLSPRGSPAPKPINVTYAVNTDLIEESGTITQGDVVIGRALQHITGTFQNEGDAKVVNLKVNAPNMPVDDLEAMLPAFGVILPSGSRLMGGTLSADLAVTGPVDKAVVTGPVRLSNTKLANFDLGAKLGALQAFTGKVGGSSDTTIQNFSTNARASALEGTKADAINLTIPALGVITGAGTVSPAGELNFRMLANLQGGLAGGLTKTVAMGAASKGVAFSIQGTASNPKFIPDVGSVATSVATGAIQGALSGKAPGGVSSGVSALGGLLGGKKKPQ